MQRWLWFMRFIGYTRLQPQLRLAAFVNNLEWVCAKHAQAQPAGRAWHAFICTRFLSVFCVVAGQLLLVTGARLPDTALNRPRTRRLVLAVESFLLGGVTLITCNGAPPLLERARGGAQ
jgi:hypothetical protein